jgi:hypothetical protein
MQRWPPPQQQQQQHLSFSLLCCAVLCCAVLCCAVLCCAVLCCAVLCCAVLCTASCVPNVFLHASCCCCCCQVIAKEAGAPQAELWARVQALLNVLPGMDAKLQAMRPADVVSDPALSGLGRVKH